MISLSQMNVHVVSGYNSFHTFLLNCFFFSFVVKRYCMEKIKVLVEAFGIFFSLKKLPAIITLTE